MLENGLRNVQSRVSPDRQRNEVIELPIVLIGIGIGIDIIVLILFLFKHWNEFMPYEWTDVRVTVGILVILLMLLFVSI